MELKKSLKVGSYTIALTHTDKIVFPRDGITKMQVIDYYNSIAERMVFYAKKHLISMVRYSNTIDDESFFQKNAGDYFPAWITRKQLTTSEGKEVNYVVLDKKATLVYLANQMCLTPHIWLSTSSKLHKPDRLVIDLDPSGKRFDFNQVRYAALLFKELFEQLGLMSYVMTTGSRGLHVVVPLKQTDDFEQVRKFVFELVSYATRISPQYFTVTMRKSERGKKIFLDYLRNSYSATAVAPYAIRAKDTAPVATPLDWHEIEDKKLASTTYTIKNVFKRLEKKGDPWHDFYKKAQSIKTASKKLKQMIGDEE